jgi:Ribonucleases G and E
LNKLIITRWNGRILTALFSRKQALELGLEENASILGNIYIGRIIRIVKNLNAAFVDFGEGLTGYYSLEDNPLSLPIQQSVKKEEQETDADTFGISAVSSRELKGGDEIIIQVAKEAIKTKDPVLSANLNFPGKYVVLTTGKKSISFSSKIHDKAWKDQLRPQLDELLPVGSGLIVRTNGYLMEKEILTEARQLLQMCSRILDSAAYRTCGSLLYEAEPEYLKSIKSSHTGTLEEILTDQPDVFHTIKDYLEHSQPEDLKKLRLYQDPLLTLTGLYSLKAVMEQACQKRVWLKSGGYLVIEPTEAMVVIDVNTGKYSGKKNQNDTIRMINLEAAEEICRQLRLRNLSGIIMVDFIDMREENDKALLMEHLRRHAALDPVKTTVVDMTQLNLVELTRKKGKKPLWEQLLAVNEENASGFVRKERRQVP